MFKKEKTMNVAAALRLGHTMTIRKKEYVVVGIGTHQDGNLSFTFKNVKDGSCLNCNDVPPMTLVTINISREELAQQIENELFEAGVSL